jgi:hypothetical protein
VSNDKRKLSAEILKCEAEEFARYVSRHKEKSLYGVTDGKAVGTFLQHMFRRH